MSQAETNLLQIIHKLTQRIELLQSSNKQTKTQLEELKSQFFQFKEAQNKSKIVAPTPNSFKSPGRKQPIITEIVRPERVQSGNYKNNKVVVVKKQQHKKQEPKKEEIKKEEVKKEVKIQQKKEQPNKIIKKQTKKQSKANPVISKKVEEQIKKQNVKDKPQTKTPAIIKKEVKRNNQPPPKDIKKIVGGKKDPKLQSKIIQKKIQIEPEQESQKHIEIQKLQLSEQQLNENIHPQVKIQQKKQQVHSPEKQTNEDSVKLEENQREGQVKTEVLATDKVVQAIGSQKIVEEQQVVVIKQQVGQKNGEVLNQ